MALTIRKCSHAMNALIAKKKKPVTTYGKKDGSCSSCSSCGNLTKEYSCSIKSCCWVERKSK